MMVQKNHNDTTKIGHDVLQIVVDFGLLWRYISKIMGTPRIATYTMENDDK